MSIRLALLFLQLSCCIGILVICVLQKRALRKLHDELKRWRP